VEKVALIKEENTKIQAPITIIKKENNIADFD
jgi:hypothetical protein